MRDYNVKTGCWQSYSIPNLPIIGESPTATLCEEGKVFIIGGDNHKGVF